MRTLLFWGDGAPRIARKRHAAGATFVLWKEENAHQLEAAAVPFSRVGTLLTLEQRDEIDEVAMAWTKAWGKRPLIDGKSFRELLEWKGTSLWWFAELYLYHSTASPHRVRVIETLLRILEEESPDEVEALGLTREDTVLLARACSARRVLFHGSARPFSLAGRSGVWSTALVSRLNTTKALLTAVKAKLAGPPPAPTDPRGAMKRVLFLSHAAFWRARRENESEAVQQYEHYFDRLIPEVDATGSLRSFVVAVGPRAAFRRRGVWDRLSDWLRLRTEGGPYVHMNRYMNLAVFREVWRGTGQIRKVWRRLLESPALHDVFSHRGCVFADLSGTDLAQTLLLQLPWAIRSYEEMRSVLGAVRPSLLCLYAESSGWGRAALAAAKALGIPSVALQHGIVYPKYYSYIHGADEADCPRPDRTAVFGEAARRLLIERGHYPPESLVTTGSPKFDALVEATRDWDRAALRKKYGCENGDRLVIVASRYRAIRETHQSIGSAFSLLIRAVESLSGVRCVVKPHPAESAHAYEADLRRAGATRVEIVPRGTDLLELLFAGDALVTVESLSAVEALVLGRPVVVLNMPTHLGDLVDAGVALGVPAGDDPRPSLERLMKDGATRESLALARLRYLSELAMGVDGRATQRILDLIRDTAGCRGVVG